jgi:flagellar basal body-associated protein FliL
MENIIIIIVCVVAFIAAVLFLAMFLNKQGWLKDEDNDWIPDVVENKVEAVKVDIAELKADLKQTQERLSKELADVGAAIKEVGNQMGDVPKAFSGKKRPGRKQNGSK